MAFNITQIEALETATSMYRVKYDSILSDSTYRPEYVNSDSGSAALMTREKAYKVADILSSKVTNAKNIEVQLKAVGQYGADEYRVVFSGAVLDVSGFTEVV